MAAKAHPVALVRKWRGVRLTIPIPQANGSMLPYPINVAIQTAEQDGDKLSGHRYCKEHMQRIRQLNSCPTCGECETVQGYEHGESVVTMTDGEIASLVPNIGNRADMSALIDAPDPTTIAKTYAIWWDDDDAAQALAVFGAALRDTGKWLVGTLHLQATTKPFALRWSDEAGTVVAHELRYADRVRWDYLSAIADAAPVVDEDSIAGAVSALEQLPSEWDVAAIRDTYNDNVRAAVEAKAGGATPTKATTADDSAPDLMTVLRASVEDAKARGAKPKIGKRGVHSPKLDQPKTARKRAAATK